MVMLTMGDSVAGEIRLAAPLRIPATTLERARRHRLHCTVLRTLRAVVYTAVAIVAIGGLPMVCAVLYDGAALALVFAR